MPPSTTTVPPATTAPATSVVADHVTSPPTKPTAVRAPTRPCRPRLERSDQEAESTICTSPNRRNAAYYFLSMQATHHLVAQSEIALLSGFEKQQLVHSRDSRPPMRHHDHHRAGMPRS